MITRKADLSELTFQDDFMIVGHESYERLADKLFFNIIENCRYHPQLPLDEIERQRVWLRYLTDNDRTFPSWRKPLIENDLSDYKKVIPKKLPICSRIKNQDGKTEVGFQIDTDETFHLISFCKILKPFKSGLILLECQNQFKIKVVHHLN